MHTYEEHNLKGPYKGATQRKEAKCPNPETGLLPGEGCPGTGGWGAGSRGESVRGIRAPTLCWEPREQAEQQPRAGPAPEEGALPAGWLRAPGLGGGRGYVQAEVRRVRFHKPPVCSLWLWPSLSAARSQKGSSLREGENVLGLLQGTSPQESRRSSASVEPHLHPPHRSSQRCAQGVAATSWLPDTPVSRARTQAGYSPQPG